MTNYKRARAILKPIRKGNGTCYGITAKGIWLDNPKERTISVWNIDTTSGKRMVGKHISDHVFNGRV